MKLREYTRRPGSTVYAIQFALESRGFDYFKWGKEQHCKQGDWIVRNGDDTYTVDAESFARTYEAIGGAEYQKVGKVWAQQAASAGSIATKEGNTDYQPGDYVVFNDQAQTDGYAVERAKFEAMYEPCDI